MGHCVERRAKTDATATVSLWRPSLTDLSPSKFSNVNGPAMEWSVKNEMASNRNVDCDFVSTVLLLPILYAVETPIHNN